MKKMIQRILRGFLSLITTFLIMASPVAAMVYASEPEIAVESFSIKEQAVPVTDKNTQAVIVMPDASSKQAAADDVKSVLTEKE